VRRSWPGVTASACLAASVSIALGCVVRPPASGGAQRAAASPPPRAAASSPLVSTSLAPRLGRHATPAELAALDIDVAPDGVGLPAGSGGAADGAAIFATRCAHCHGASGEGGPADRLVGGVGSLTTGAPILTTGSFWPYATTLFDYLRRAMPYDSPGSLSANEVYALTAFLLERNGVIEASARLDAASLPAVRMPNRDGFESAWPPSSPRAAPVGRAGSSRPPNP
jgi:S-disulfanyl-L-cysteine oxidoreductase SoxD